MDTKADNPLSSGGHAQLRDTAFYLAGCAAQAIKEGMTDLVGQPLSAAVAKLGMPTDERMIAGQKV